MSMEDARDRIEEARVYKGRKCQRI